MGKISKILGSFNEAVNKGDLFMLQKSKSKNSQDYEIVKAPKNVDVLLNMGDKKLIDFLVTSKVPFSIDHVGSENVYFNIQIYNKDEVSISDPDLNSILKGDPSFKTNVYD